MLLQKAWRSDMGVEPTQDGSTAPQTVLKTAPVTGPGAAPRANAYLRTGREEARGRGREADTQRRRPRPRPSYFSYATISQSCPAPDSLEPTTTAVVAETAMSAGRSSKPAK